MLARIRKWLLPDKPRVGPEFTTKMHDARAYGVTQQRESLKAQRRLQIERENRVEAAYLHRKNGGGHA